jgi:hypothetical protein
MNWINVLELSAEGGCITLQGCKNENSTWSFKNLTNESAFADLLSEEDAEGLESNSESVVVEGLDNALKMLSERYPFWANLYPTELYEEFAESVIQRALSQKRCIKDIWLKLLVEKNPSAATIGTIEEFTKALLAVYDKGLPESHLKMLQAQYRATNSTITATQLAKAAKYKSYHAANLQYGTLACNVAKVLGYNPEIGADGKPRWWTTLSYSKFGTTESDKDHFQFIMRPELIEALSSMVWIKLQNRVTPYSDIERSIINGDMMGNRRKLHNNYKEIVRKWNGKRWIYCLLDCEGIQREVMSPNNYTELFFLDEATALSAGHRPCSSCQTKNKKYSSFMKKWLSANSSYYELPNAFVDSIDKIIHEERIDQEDHKVTYLAKATELPDGVYIELDGKPYLKWKNQLLEWSHAGYSSVRNIPKDLDVKVLTPKSLVRCIEDGFTPDVHVTALKYCS